MKEADCIVFENVSRFYGDVLGVNRVNLCILPGITSLVGPNGAGKTTLMNLMTGLLRPTQGEVRILGLSTQDPERLFRKVGYCTQFDTFPKGMTGYQFLHSFLTLHGMPAREASARAQAALEMVNLAEAAHRPVAAYSKGMRQRVKLALALAHDPQVLVLDEPLNGLDPMSRAETIALFRSLAAQGRHVIVSSHILHEVDLISDRVILLTGGYVIAEGEIRGVREEVKGQPLQIFLRTPTPSRLAALLFERGSIAAASLTGEADGLLVRTHEPDRVYLLLNVLVAEAAVDVETVAPADEDVNSVYHYLIGSGGGR